MRFADMLVEAMDGLTQAEVAQRSGLHYSAISRLVRRERHPSYHTVVALRRALPKLRELMDREAA